MTKMVIIPMDRLTYPDLNRYTAPPNARTRIININEFRLPDVPASVVDLEIIYRNVLKKKRRTVVTVFTHSIISKIACGQAVLQSLRRIAGTIV